MSDIEFEAEGELAEASILEDPIAQRIREVKLLLEMADKLKNKALVAEAIEWSKKTRDSFKSHSRANVTSLPGGKSMDKPL